MAELAVAEQLQEQAGMDADVDAHLRTALQIEPTCVPARQLLLRRLAKAQRWDELVDALQQGLAVSPGQVSWALSLARVQYEQGKLGSADGTLAQYQSFADSSAEFADFAGHVKLKLGQNAQAVAQFQRAVRLEPHDGRGWLGLGLALEAAGHRAESQEALQRSLAVGTLSRDLADLAIRHLQH
ncbi:MAG: hypothetical protein JO006_03630 [Paucibacter sp.]|nr:hypothetical protein [Roseateles sp.]